MPATAALRRLTDAQLRELIADATAELEQRAAPPEDPPEEPEPEPLPAASGQGTAGGGWEETYYVTSKSGVRYGPYRRTRRTVGGKKAYGEYLGKGQRH